MNAPVPPASVIDPAQPRHDWTLAEVEALFELPFTELVFRAADVHRRLRRHRVGGRFQRALLRAAIELPVTERDRHGHADRSRDRRPEAPLTIRQLHAGRRALVASAPLR